MKEKETECQGRHYKLVWLFKEQAQKVSSSISTNGHTFDNHIVIDSCSPDFQLTAMSRLAAWQKNDIKPL